MKIEAGNLKKGGFVIYRDNLSQIQKAEHYMHGRGGAIMRVKFKDVESGKTMDATFRSDEILESADVTSVRMQFLYADPQGAHFMDESYNQYSVATSIIGEYLEYLKEGDQYFVYLYKDQAVAIRPPASVNLKVTETEDAVRGDRVSAGRKKAIVETGATIMVPLFVKNGDLIVINPETGEYVERVK